MKKRIRRIAILLCVLLMVISLGGCSKGWKEYVEVSNLWIEESSVASDYIKGNITNKTDKYYKAQIEIEIKGGTTNTSTISYVDLRPNEIAEFFALTSYPKDYKYTVKNVELKEETVPYLADTGDISVEAAEYYFPDIFDTYEKLMVFITTDFDIDGKEYPFITKIEREEGKIIFILRDKKTDMYLMATFKENSDKLYSFAISWAEDKVSDNFFLFPESTVFGFSDNIAHSIQELIKSPDGEYYTGGGWGINVERREGEVMVMLVRS